MPPAAMRDSAAQPFHCTFKSLGCAWSAANTVNTPPAFATVCAHAVLLAAMRDSAVQPSTCTPATFGCAWSAANTALAPPA
eukprot:CAMPEP_0183356516 /NCGR_PEP_ID=MMETSP0164_2-20130417/44717_1 /TAXON_ID=221442 /ORGANISM="Coccolithus pelagicus ssp braarudi, Strain PLY182g" /LENGTH=80 /DNA_ID=CAMNT_0025529955 /DNA_START=18 /DNA_END=257 /DNA_ORIENTATION=+